MGSNCCKKVKEFNVILDVPNTKQKDSVINLKDFQISLPYSEVTADYREKLKQSQNPKTVVSEFTEKERAEIERISNRNKKLNEERETQIKRKELEEQKYVQKILHNNSQGSFSDTEEEEGNINRSFSHGYRERMNFSVPFFRSNSNFHKRKRTNSPKSKKSVKKSIEIVSQTNKRKTERNSSFFYLDQYNKKHSDKQKPLVSQDEIKENREELDSETIKEMVKLEKISKASMQSMKLVIEESPI